MATTVVVVVPPNNAAAYSNPNAGQQGPPAWAIGLFDIGDCGSCCTAWCCGCCAIASARNMLDGSDWYVNCCFLGAPAARYLVRTNYGIEGNAHWDCWTSLFCPCCTVNQLYQTVKQRGRTTVPNVGPQANVNPRAYKRRSCMGCLYDIAYGTICSPCAVGYIVESAGVPCWYGACCFSVMGAVSTQRYVRRIQPTLINECVEDCLIPCTVTIAASVFVGSYAQLVDIPCGIRALSDENVYKNRADCCYGLDCFGAIGYAISYCTSCSCKAPEGRYLISEA